MTATLSPRLQLAIHDGDHPRCEPPAPAAREVEARRTAPDIVDVWGHDSFPASDAPANW